MNCPHCGYEERTFNNETCEYEYNEEYGRFYKLDQLAFRESPTSKCTDVLNVKSCSWTINENLQNNI